MGEITKSATAGMIAGAIGGVFGVAVASWLADGNKILGASWWDVLTSFGTVGAVAAAVGLDICRRRLNRKKRAVLARLAGPIVAMKLIDLKSVLLRLFDFKERVSSTLINSSEERGKLRSSLKDLQQTFTKDEVHLLVDFELKAAQSISVVNASLEHCIFHLKQLTPTAGTYPKELVSKFYEALELALEAVKEASEHAARWSTWK